MFLTITIDTAQKKKVKINKSRISPTKGWRKMFGMKKKSLMNKFIVVRRPISQPEYILNRQTSMFR